MIKLKTVLMYTIVLIGLTLFYSCKEDDETVLVTTAQKFRIEGTKIIAGTKSTQFIGANSFQVFGTDEKQMVSWNMNITREFIGNILEQPLTGSPIKDLSGSYLHSLQSIVDKNRKNNRITILCGFGWDGKKNNEFTGKSPSQTFWLASYKEKLKQWAVHFMNQSDVWIEVWNEPYRYDRADGYTDDIWEKDMTELVATIRNTGNQSIILVPCAEQGQDESVLINRSASFLQKNPNIIFDIHAYEKWLLESDLAIIKKLDLLRQNNIPIIFGETAPMNAGVLMNPSFFLNTIHSRGLSVCAWVWKYDENDQDALLTAMGMPNDNNNNNWGSTFKNIATKPRNP
jgi:mannan endo-1,4-beta-mannosidase